MLRSAFNQLRRRAPWLLDPIVRLRQRKWLADEISSGRYAPSPAAAVHFADYERASETRYIPPLWHTTWKDANLPPAFAENRQILQRLHPAPRWTHHLWTDAEIDPFVRENFAGLYEAYRALPKIIMRIDLFRYMVLAVQGGVYCDLDFRMFHSAEGLLSDCTLLLPAESDDLAQINFIAQHFLASCPGHVFWHDVIHAVLDRPLEEIRAYSDPIASTGPHLVTRIWRAGREKYAAKVPARVFLSPPSMLSKPGFSIPPNSLGLHDCTGTWR